jgi:hypothetical protein
MVSLDTPPKVWIAYRPLPEEIDRPTEQCFQRLLEAKIPIECRARGIGLEFNDKINIASRRIEVLTRRRAEEVEFPHVKATAQRRQFRAMGLDDGLHDAAPARLADHTTIP